MKRLYVCMSIKKNEYIDINMNYFGEKNKEEPRYETHQELKAWRDCKGVDIFDFIRWKFDDQLYYVSHIPLYELPCVKTSYDKIIKLKELKKQKNIKKIQTNKKL